MRTHEAARALPDRCWAWSPQPPVSAPTRTASCRRRSTTRSRAAHPPALRIKSGDRVITTTVDDIGTGADGKTLAQGPNPQTGPFYIEGAEPGDLIVVTIEKLEPNRATGLSTSLHGGRTRSMPGAWPTRPARPRPLDDRQGERRRPARSGQRDSAASTGALATARRCIELPLRPMLGSLGVAPADGRSAGTTVSGPFGGNLDLRRPHRRGQGHAAGVPARCAAVSRSRAGASGRRRGWRNGIETSMDVEFSVELVKKKEWPHSSVDATLDGRW